MLKFESKQMLEKLNKMFNTTLEYDEYADYPNYISPIKDDSYFTVNIPETEEYDEDLELYYYNSIILVFFDSNYDIVDQKSIDMQKYCSNYCC
jgi:hypothetical protein